MEPHFLVQFPEHGLLGTFAAVDAALRKLPGMCADALAPENLVSLVEQDDADVGPEAVPVKHNQTPIFELSPLCMPAPLQATDEGLSCPLIPFRIQRDPR
jgi:hypothetical protein